MQFEASLAPLDVLAPCLSRQGELLSVTVAQVSFAEVIAPVRHPGLRVFHAFLNELGETRLWNHVSFFVDNPPLHSLIDIPVWVGSQEAPD